MQPFFAKVVVQDGIYWKFYYPEHEASRLLLNAMPVDYERWAARVRNDVVDLAQAKEDVLVLNLNEAAKAALMKVVDCIYERFDRYMLDVTVLNDVNRKLRMSIGTVIRLLHCPDDGPSIFRTLQMPATEIRVVV